MPTTSVPIAPFPSFKDPSLEDSSLDDPSPEDPSLKVPSLDDLSLEDLLNVLSVAQYSAHEDELSKSQFDAIESKYNKHLRLLDAIALVMVQRKKGNVAAVTYKLLSNSSTGRITMQFYFTKNHACSSAKLAHIDSIFRLLNDVQSHKITIEDAADDLISIIVNDCAPKVKDRLTKLVQAWTGLKIEGMKWIEPAATTKERPLIRFYEPNPPPANTTYVKTLTAHLDRLQQLQQVPSEDVDVQAAVTKTALLNASGAAFMELYGKNNIGPAAAKLRRKMTKFSRYFHDIVYLVKQARKYTQYSQGHFTHVGYACCYWVDHLTDARI